MGSPHFDFLLHLHDMMIVGDSKVVLDWFEGLEDKGVSCAIAL